MGGHCPNPPTQIMKSLPERSLHVHLFSFRSILQFIAEDIVLCKSNTLSLHSLKTYNDFSLLLGEEFWSLIWPKGHIYFGLCLTSQPHYEPISPLLFPRELHHSPVRSFKVPNAFLPQSPLIGNILISDQMLLPQGKFPSPSRLGEVLELQIFIDAFVLFHPNINHNYTIYLFTISLLPYTL